MRVYMCAHARVCVCVRLHSKVVRASVFNQKVVSSIPSVAILELLLFPWARNFTQSTQLDLVLTREAAYPAGIKLLSMAASECHSGGTSGARTIILCVCMWVGACVRACVCVYLV